MMGISLSNILTHHLSPVDMFSSKNSWSDGHMFMPGLVESETEEFW